MFEKCLIWLEVQSLESKEGAKEAAESTKTC
jgi:hypothetical protein